MQTQGLSSMVASSAAVRQGPMHMRQLFARVRGGTIAQSYRSSHGRKYLDELGIKVPDGTTFQLHRGGDTGAFVIMCRSEADAQALWQRQNGVLPHAPEPPAQHPAKEAKP